MQPQLDQGPRLEALDPASGSAAWQREMTHNAIQPVGGMLLLTRPDGTVAGVEGATGHTKWHRRIPGQSLPVFESFTNDGLAYASSPSADASSTRVTAIDPATGAVRWEARLNGNLQPVGAHDGSVFFLSTNRVYGDTDAVVRYTPASKSSRRVALPVARPDARATVRGNVVYVLAADGALDAVGVEARKRLWHLETSVSRGSAPVADGNHVYLTTADGRLLAVDAARGRLVGQTPARPGADSGQVVGTVPAPVLAQGHIYATAPDGTVFAVDARNPAAW